MGKADLHIHTAVSDGMGTISAVLEAASRYEEAPRMIADEIIGRAQGK